MKKRKDWTLKWIGLTGGIATGKTAAKKLLEALGFKVVDADVIARLVVDPAHEGYKLVVSHFGNSILSSEGLINRAALADIIFKSEEQKVKLESLLHPLIQAEVQRQKMLHQVSGQRVCFYDVPLLFEKKLKSQFDYTILVWCNLETQKARLKSRNNLSDQQVDERLRAQMPLSEKLPLADFCIDNSTTLNNLDLQIKSLVKKLL